MWNRNEKHSEHDSPHSKRHRDGVHTVLCDCDARNHVVSRMSVISIKIADLRIFHSLKHDE